MIVRSRLVWPSLLLLCATGCGSSPSQSAAGDTGVEEDTAEAGLPPLDAAACPKVTGDEAPLTFVREYVPLSSGTIVGDKAFYLATLLDGTPGVRDAITADALSTDRDARFRKAATDCAGKLACILDLVGWKDAEAKAGADAVVLVLNTAGKLGLLVGTHMRRSGMFNLHAADTDEAMVRDAFLDMTAAWNQTLGSTGAEVAPDKLDAAMKSASTANPGPLPFHASTQIVVLAVLTAAARDEAARYEPLTKGENAAAMARLASIDFGAFPFIAIVVPGLGPLDLTTPLSEGGRMRADMAADRFAAKLAPFIALSGGHVHPDRTPYSEAIEMKKYLMKSRGVPESALLVDPHARHTTTNLRNVARLLLRYGFPLDRPALVTTDLGQSGYMQGTGFSGRCSRELGYLPWRVLSPLSPLDSCFIPSKASLHADGRDALDP